MQTQTEAWEFTPEVVLVPQIMRMQRERPLIGKDQAAGVMLNLIRTTIFSLNVMTLELPSPGIEEKRSFFAKLLVGP